MNGFSLQLGKFIKQMKGHKEYWIYQFMSTKSSLWQNFMKIPHYYENESVWWKLLTLMKIHQMKITYIYYMRSTHQADQLCFTMLILIWPLWYFPWVWVGQINIKDHNNSVEAETGTELGNIMSILVVAFYHRSNFFEMHAPPKNPGSTPHNLTW